MPEQHIIIIGSGFAGLGMAIRLKEAGITDFTVYEQADRVGGTWRDNHYPGAACDIESHLYSFSFAPNPRWSRTFGPQAEILAYLESCVERFGLGPHMRMNTAITKAAFDEATGTWEVETRAGERRQARVLIACCGGLSRPSLPDIAGLDTFGGPMFHSARWDNTADLNGKRVAVIGTGASAIQIVPAIAPLASELAVFQRTPPWILPKADEAISEAQRERFARFPALQRLARAGQYLRHELFALAFVREPWILRAAERLAKLYLEKSVADPALREKLTPSYTMGCKRILLSNDYYRALQRQNVELVTDPIEAVVPEGIVTKSGARYDVDAIVLATGFQAAEAVAPFALRGRGGLDLNEAWRDGAEAYLGTTVAGFPNFFIIVGPNVGLGHSSMVYMIESQIAYILSSVSLMRERGWMSVDVRKDAQARFNERLHARFPKTVWSTGCVSWYRTRSGKNTTLWPGFTFEYRLKTRRFDPAAYDVVPLR